MGKGAWPFKWQRPSPRAGGRRARRCGMRAGDASAAGLVRTRGGSRASPWDPGRRLWRGAAPALRVGGNPAWGGQWGRPLGRSAQWQKRRVGRWPAGVPAGWARVRGTRFCATPGFHCEGQAIRCALPDPPSRGSKVSRGRGRGSTYRKSALGNARGVGETSQARGVLGPAEGPGLWPLIYPHGALSCYRPPEPGVALKSLKNWGSLLDLTSIRGLEGALHAAWLCSGGP